ncbi:MAG: methyl-accepting chemotaxis protein [Gammaproteobacteria bacterium]|nr:methyl-accepting chemotaxis protein [Gammaproteobacteria bacterium]
MINRVSLRLLTLGSVIGIGTIAVTLSFFSASLFKNAAESEEVRILSRITQVSSQEIIKELALIAQDLGTTAGKSSEFRNAYTQLDEPENSEFVVNHLNEQFAQRFVTSGLLKLNKLRLYDQELRFTLESSEGISGLPRKLPTNLYETAKVRKGGDRFKALSELWISDHGPMHSVLVPVGGLRLSGYLEVVVDPAFNLRKLEEVLNTAVRIKSIHSEETFKTDNWPSTLDANSLVVPYELADAAGKTLLVVDIVENLEKFNSSFFKTQLLSVGTMLVLIVIGVVATVIAMRKFLLSPMNDLITNMEQVEDGNLTIKVEANGLKETHRLGRSLKSLVQSLSSQVTQIHTHAGHLSSAAEELAIVTGQTNGGVQEQQKETDQVATAINEMSATVQEVARNAEAAAEAARNADTETRTGQKVVSQTMTDIDALAREIERATTVINKLESDSENIGSVMDVIRGIAEQTNLLALNAAIEAARAGEQGRGFAVVADEVRVLASRTQESTREIHEMIERLQSGAKDAVNVMNESQERARETVEQAAKAGTSLQTIASAVSSINEMNTQIASAAEEQTAVADEINNSIVNISKIAETTSQGASRTAGSSEALKELATKLQSVVTRFRVN